MISKVSNNASHCVLVVAPFGRDGELLERTLNKAEIEAERVSNVAELCARIKSDVGSVLIAEEALTDASLRQLEECVKDQEPWSDLPIFVMAHQGGTEGRLLLKTLKPLGNVTILERPLRRETLVSAFHAGLQARTRQYQLRTLLESERRAAKALRESESRYRKLAEALPLLVWTCKPNGECDYLSKQWIEYTGVAEKVQLGFGWLSLIHPDDYTRTEQAWKVAYQTGAQYDVEFRLRRADGAYRWFKTRGVPVKNPDGEVEKWFGSCTDIEDQKKISEDRRDLLISEQKARTLAELLNRVGPMLLQELDPQRLTQKVIDLATQLIGAQFGALFYNVETGTAEDRAPYAISSGSPDDIQIEEPVFAELRTIVSEDITKDRRFEKFAARSGTPAKSYLAAPVMSRAGSIVGGLLFVSRQAGAFRQLHVQLAEGIAAQASIALDNARLFAEAQDTQETLKRSNADLRRANEDLNQFAYSASHDLQEPLRMVALYSQMMQRKYHHLLDGLGAEYLSYMVQGARRMELLLKDLLDYTQVVSDNEGLAQTTDANVVLEDVQQNLCQTVASSEAEIDSRRLPQVAVKRVHLLQLFQNLISNALKYRSAAKPMVNISAEPDGMMWRFSIRDNGIGIAKEYRRLVFGLFKRLHGNSQYEGTGIGLAICQKIVERYGGNIWVESEGEGMGCNFLFTLPGVGNELG